MIVTKVRAEEMVHPRGGACCGDRAAEVEEVGGLRAGDGVCSGARPLRAASGTSAFPGGQDAFPSPFLARRMLGA